MLPLGDDERIARRRFRSLLLLVAFEGWSGSPARGLVKKPPEPVKFLWDFTSRSSTRKTLGIVFVNKTGDNIVGVTQADNVAASLTVSGREFCRLYM
jgi:hypothetical protein